MPATCFKVTVLLRSTALQHRSDSGCAEVKTAALAELANGSTRAAETAAVLPGPAFTVRYEQTVRHGMQAITL